MRPKNKRERFEVSVRKGNKRTEQNSPIARNCTTMCSCYMCGNPRKYWKEKTLDERRNDQIKDI